MFLVHHCFGRKFHELCLPIHMHNASLFLMYDVKIYSEKAFFNKMKGGADAQWRSITKPGVNGLFDFISKYDLHTAILRPTFGHPSVKSGVFPMMVEGSGEDDRTNTAD